MIDIDTQRLNTEIETLAKISDTPYPSVTRVLFTKPDLEARAYLKSLYAKAGLVVREDAVGNTFARWQGADSSAPAVATGSHTDAIPNAGRFDGVVGVLGGLEAIRALQRAGARPRRSIELIMFTAEEPTRFGFGCLGSRMMAGTLSAEKLAALRDSGGRTLDEARAEGRCTGSLASVKLSRDTYDSFVELHIEQGSRLEQAGMPIGVVTAIAAPATLRVQFTGAGGHAGTVLMPERHDPSLAAAETMLAIERAANETGNINSVATCGLVQILPGAVNSIPREVRLDIDIRDIDLARRDRMLAEVRAFAKTAAARRGCGWSEELVNADPPATCDPRLISTVAASCRDLGLKYQEMTSRAYHDSLFMALVCPTTMIFVPSRGGYSHRPDEFTSLEQISDGVRVLASTLQKLAS
jgi:ureidoglycolate amidohydrolase